ncbi:hypothetical protein E2C01_000935 [Portunus trituberculatus]|uniref:Secreted protein n=1 Tax=Portunus trituberculatus TaxID=210409 RepID=A0A5B7CHZ4_PORTR|nr:hypothetical protein [Portunus trituberculatus]
MGSPQQKRLDMFLLLFCSLPFFLQVLDALGHLMVNAGHLIQIIVQALLDVLQPEVVLPQAIVLLLETVQLLLHILEAPAASRSR